MINSRLKTLILEKMKYYKALNNLQFVSELQELHDRIEDDGK